MNCNEVRDRLIEYLDGAIGEEGRQLALHLTDCPGCQREYRDLVQTIRMVREVDLPDPGPAFWNEHRSAIIGAAREHLGRAKTGAPLFRRLFRPLDRAVQGAKGPSLLPLSGALMVVLAVVSGAYLWRTARPGVDGPPGDAHLILADDVNVLAEAYLNGTLFHDSSSLDELNDLSDRELGEVFRAMADDYDLALSADLDEMLRETGSPLEVGAEIEDLGPGETSRLLKLLGEMQAAG